MPVRDEIAWSRDADQHLALLGELQALRQTLGRAAARPACATRAGCSACCRRRSALFASVPNYGETLAEAHRLFEERLRESPVLREWWARPTRRATAGRASRE